jgi:ATP-binding cassette subfamily C protein CydC
MEPFAALRRGAMELGRTALAARRIAPRLATGSAIAERCGPALDIAVNIDNVDFCHDGSPANVVTAFSLTVLRGERIALVGSSGAGKSSLLDLIAGELEPVKGRICTLGTTLLTQRTELFQDSLRDNLRLADPAADDLRLMAALADAGVASHVLGLPRGLDTILGEGGLGLSGGQSRRLSLARFLLRDEPLWLLDEPTEGLDGETARDVLARIAARAGKRTVIIATHIRREAMLADRLIILEGGVISADLTRGEAAFDAALLRLRPD